MGFERVTPFHAGFFDCYFCRSSIVEVVLKLMERRFDGNEKVSSIKCCKNFSGNKAYVDKPVPNLAKIERRFNSHRKDCDF